MIKDYFRLPDSFWAVPVRLKHVIIAFAIYFFGGYVSTHLYLNVLNRQSFASTVSYLSWFNFTSSSLILFLLILFFLFLPKTVRALLGRESISWKDLSVAGFVFIVAFITVIPINHLLEKLTLVIFQLKEIPEQLAVIFLKSTFKQPSLLLLAFISISIYAPLIEETLFRGFLQTFIRQHLGSKQAIFITSACFSLFHFSTTQGVGNISIIISLFFLSLFLGFLYEKQRNILAPMLLHSLFNTVSALSLYLFGGISTTI
jgi:membrane protease YdiL (CAAX protease family)